MAEGTFSSTSLGWRRGWPRICGGTRVAYELGMDRTGKMAASSVPHRSPGGITGYNKGTVPAGSLAAESCFSMFDNLSEKLQRVFKSLRGEGRLSAENMEGALREIRLALLEADVNFKVVNSSSRT